MNSTDKYLALYIVTYVLNADAIRAQCHGEDQLKDFETELGTLAKRRHGIHALLEERRRQVVDSRLHKGASISQVGCCVLAVISLL